MNKIFSSINYNEELDIFLTKYTNADFLIGESFICIPAVQESYFVEVSKVSIFLEAFGQLQCYIWHANRGKASSQKIRDYKRAFSDWNLLRKSVLSEDDWMIHEESGRIQKYYSDITKITHDNILDAVSLFGFSFEDMLTFFIESNASNSFIDMSIFKKIMEKNRQISSYSTSHGTPVQYKQIVYELYMEIIQYINEFKSRIVKSGGIIALSAHDCDANRYIFLIGETSLLESRIDMLEKKLGSMSFDQFKKLVKSKLWLNFDGFTKYFILFLPFTFRAFLPLIIRAFLNL